MPAINAEVHDLQIIPLGLSFEDKGNPGTAVLAEVGEPVSMDKCSNIGVEDLTATRCIETGRGFAEEAGTIT